jgi:hypothetical protein
MQHKKLMEMLLPEYIDSNKLYEMGIVSPSDENTFDH